MIQKEVAQRICAKDNKESLLSISVKIYGKPSIVDYVKAGSFVPAPKVDSAIIKIEQISKDKLNGLTEDLFFKLVKAGFSHKRKMLSGNLKKYFESNIEEIFLQAGINPKERAENLKIEDWIKLAKTI
jgi:16S rRNA (adenine1518-N6/adenine1519-N6)-dimethyltransferase